MKIYVITVFTDIQEENGVVHMGSSRTWGFHTNKQYAIEALHNNSTDMYECIYDYAILQCYEEGTVSNCVGVEWFQYDPNRDGYFEIDQPLYVSDWYGVVMG